MSKNSNVVLIGMPGSGKSTIGKLLAETLKRDFIDTDQMIIELAGKTPRQLVEEKGLEYFLKLQDQAVLSINQSNCVIATGGGLVHSDIAMHHLKSIGFIVYLDTKYDIIEERMDKSRKLVNTGGSLLELYNKRVPLYDKYANIVLNCDLDNPQLLCNRLLDAIDHML